MKRNQTAVNRKKAQADRWQEPGRPGNGETIFTWFAAATAFMLVTASI
jgi:hypothetical protein